MSLYFEIDQTRPTRAEISINALVNNFQIVKDLVGDKIKIISMVKANGYGHGILRISEELIRAGSDYLGVAYIEEAVYLRKSGITAPIIVLGAVNSWQIADFINYDIEITSSSISKSQAISEVAKTLGKMAKVHLKFDTGMARIGVQWYNCQSFIKESISLPNIEIVGLSSHLAKAESDREFSLLQIERFKEIVEIAKKMGASPSLLHLANSAGIINYKESHFTAVRPGLMLYGYNPNGYLPQLKFMGKRLIPVMNLFSKVSYFKVVPPNTGISYNHTFVTTKESRIVTLPIGYGDGYSRALSNKGTVLINHRQYPIVGNICMDQLMVNLGSDGSAYNGDDVLLFGENGEDILPLEEVAEKAGTIVYELISQIAYRVPRVYK